MICFVEFGGGLKCPSKIHLNTQCPPRIYKPSYGPAATRLRLMIMITWISRKFLDKQEWWIAFSWFVIKLLSRYKYVVQCVHVFQTLKNGFSNRAYGIMVSPLFSFRLFFVSGGTITNDLSTARNRSIIWRHCLCIGNGSGNIARNNGTGWCTFMSFSWPSIALTGNWNV